MRHKPDGILRYPAVQSAVARLKNNSIAPRLRASSWLYLFLAPAIIYTFVFRYIPIYGAQIAFRNYFPGRAMLESPWVGLEHFRVFMSSFQFGRVMVNTVLLSLAEILFTFPLPILMAISLHYISVRWIKKGAQLVTYAPYFISTIVVAGILLLVLSPRTGPINVVLRSLGREPIFFLGMPQYFRSIYVASSIWQFTGYHSIIYIAVLASVDLQLHEAALIDGANKLERIIHVDIPFLLPTTSVLLVMRLGRTLELGFEKAYALQNPLNLRASEIIQTYVYKIGLEQAQFSYAAAIGLFVNVINFTILLLANEVARRSTSHSLF